jgi:hypothetical protein
MALLPCHNWQMEEKKLLNVLGTLVPPRHSSTQMARVTRSLVLNPTMKSAPPACPAHRPVVLSPRYAYARL